MSDFAIANVLPGKLNALVKHLRDQMKVTDSNEAVRRITSGEWVVVEASSILVAKELPNIDNVKMYAELGMKAEYEAAKLLLPNSPFHWNLAVIPGVTCNRVKAKMCEMGVKVSCADDLDGSVLENARHPSNGAYVRSFLREVEPSRPIKLLSYDRPKETVAEESTILEAWLLEFGYFLATGGKHLTHKKIARCGASRRVDGDVPGLYWSILNSRLCVNWCSPQDLFDFLLARSADFLPIEASGAQPQ